MDSAECELRDKALEFLRGDVRRLCKVLWPLSPETAEAFDRAHAKLPTVKEQREFCNEWMAESLEMWAGQFGGRAPRPAVTAAFAEVMREMED